jgi:hypothetical protein
MNRRNVLKVGGAMLMLGAWTYPAAQQLPEATVYLSPTCGCCEYWLKHIESGGFRVKSIKLDDVGPMKRKLGVPQAMESCHTAVIGGYVIEGHVPAADVKRLLRERSAKGLAVPGMVPGSPGMEGGTPKPYATVAFDAAGTRVFAKH